METYNRSAIVNNIYKILIGLSVAGPLLASYIAARSYMFSIFVMFLIIVIPHIIIWHKYYNKLDNNNFQTHIKTILKTFILSTVILAITFIPTFSGVYTDNGTEKYNIMPFIEAFFWVAGSFIAWFYYVSKIVKGLKLLNKQMERKNEQF